MIQIRNLAAVAAVAAALAVLSARSHAEIDPLTLYQRCGRSPWIVLGEVEDGDDRLAEIRVLDVIKGEYRRPTLRVVFRLENWVREQWEGKIAFSKGDQVLLFLKRYDPEATGGTMVPEKLAAEDVFASAFGAMGVFSLPAEGQEAFLEAARVFARVTGIQDAVEQEEAILGMLGSGNPEIVEAALERTHARRLALPEHIPVLLRISEGGRGPARVEALGIVVQVAEDLQVSGRSLPDQQEIVNLLKARAIGGELDGLRAEAVKVVARLGGASEREFLRQLARQDHSQIVRYEAGRALLALGD